MARVAFALSLLCVVAGTIQLEFIGHHYRISVGGHIWLTSADIAFHVNGGWQSVEKGDLHLASNTTSKGSDAVGTYERHAWAWTGSNGFQVTTAFRVYSNNAFVAFEQVWTSGGKNTQSGTSSDTLSAFPSFALQEGAVPLGSVGWHGTFIDDSTNGPRVGKWPTGGVATGNDGGPNALFSGDATGDVVVLSAGTYFMSHSLANLKVSNSDTFLAAGVMGTVTEIPSGFSMETVMSYGAHGLNNAMTQWGQTLLTAHGTKRVSGDETLSTLGYNTDHGAYYYYHPEHGKSMAQTLVDVQKYAQQTHIPYQWILLDSWWYFKGKGGGVKNWTATPTTFPPGGDAALAAFHHETKWPIMGHNRWWSSDTVYAKQNGGDFEFSDNKAKMVVPLEQRFWDWLMTKSAKWGLKVYEQDWLYNELNGVPLLTESPTMGREWLMQMGRGAMKANLTIQYCMPYPRHVLQSVEIPTVTQVRASDDYVPNTRGDLRQWHLGSSSILAHALGLRPFKDNFWTNETEPGGSCGNGRDPAVWREAAVATLSTGPVTPSDGIGRSNRELIMRSCTEGGRLLQPSRPAVTLDSTFGLRALGGSGPTGYLWTTYTMVGTGRWDHVFATQQTSSFTFTPSMLTVDRQGGATGSLVAYSVDTQTFDPKTLQVVPFSSTSPLKVPASTDENKFLLWHVAPVADGWAVLGELSKWVPVSTHRVEKVETGGGEIKVTLQGEAGEVVSMSFAHGTEVHSVSCSFTSTSTMVAAMPAATCK